ncbi:MAG: recombinase family protein [Gallionellaceae bacterium]|nr:recombinase family protein [Gallionellaceae bacterium]
MRAAIYLRVSSANGRQDEQNQEPDCSRLCAARGWEAVVFCERQSAVKHRPEWRSVCEEARLGRVGAVVFWSLDRVGRNRVQVAHDLADLFRWGVQVASVKESWVEQMQGPFRDLMIQIVAWFAEGERARLIERTRAGLARAVAKGVRLGRRPADAGSLQRALELVRMGRTPGQAAHLTGLGRTTIREYVAKMGVVRAPGEPTVLRGHRP